MKKILLLLTAIVIVFAACHKPLHNTYDKTAIPVDSANKMIRSYLLSINDTVTTDTSLHALILDADELRDFLNSEEGKKVEDLKLVFAHKLDYINNGGKGVNCGYSNKGLTLVVAGYDHEGNYQLLPNNKVMDNLQPCPMQCPTGDASDDLIRRQ